MHDIALTHGAGPRLRHSAVWVPTRTDTIDLISTTGHRDNIERGPGRHGIPDAFFLYVRGARAPRRWCGEGRLFDAVGTIDPLLKAQPIVAP